MSDHKAYARPEKIPAHNCPDQGIQLVGGGTCHRADLAVLIGETLGFNRNVGSTCLVRCIIITQYFNYRGNIACPHTSNMACY